MRKAPAKGSYLARVIALTAGLLLAPAAAFAGSLGHQAIQAAAQPAADHQANTGALSAAGHHTAPAETPLHCHQKSSAPQATAPALEPLPPDRTLPACGSAAPLFRSSTSLPDHTGPGTSIARLPRYILFGNFRS